MNELTEGVSWAAVVISFIVSFMLGWLWYGPKLFGKKWAEGVGLELGGGGDMPMAAMVTQALGTFTLAWLFGVTTASAAPLTMALAMITLVLLIISNGKYAQKSNAAILIEATYIIAMGLVMIICQQSL